MEFFKTEIFALTITVLCYFLSREICNRIRISFINPVLLTLVAVILILLATSVDYQTYFSGCRILHFLLGPSVVALAYPLYKQASEIRKRIKLIMLSVTVGAVMGIIFASGIALILRASKGVVISVAPKSVTSPIAMGISETLGGIPALTAVLVVIVGILGALFGVGFLKLLRIKSPKAVGLAIGTASHGLGTARVAELGEEYGAYSGLAMALCGVVTAVTAPLIIKLLLMI